MADGLAKMRLDAAVGAPRPHSELGDFIVEIDETLDDHPAAAHPAAGHGIVPGLLHIGRAIDFALPLAGAAHHRLDDARIANARVDGRLQLGQGVAEPVGARRQAQRLGCQAADAFAVHGQAGRSRGGDHRHHPLGLELFEHGRGDRLDLRHHELRAFGFDERAQLPGVAHDQGARMMRHLLAWRMVVAVGREGLQKQGWVCLQRQRVAIASPSRTGRAAAQSGLRRAVSRDHSTMTVEPS